jgi:hypothetical protein
MAWTIIVASSEGDQLDALVDAAQEIAALMSAGATVVQATSVEEVGKRRRSAIRRKQLLIVAASLSNRDSNSDPQAAPGLEVIKSIAQEPLAPACILVSPEIKHFLTVRAIKRCELLYVDSSTNYVRDCLQLARKLELIGACQTQAAALPQRPGEGPGGDASAAQALLQSPPIANNPLAEAQRASGGMPVPQRDEAANYALVEVHLLNNAQSGFVTIGGKSPQPLNLDRDAVDELIKESQALAERLNKARESEERWRRYSQQWSAEYQQLGERIGNLLWPTVFGHLFRIGYGQANGNVRLRFNLDQPYFDGAWEAIYDQLTQNFVMLGNTITVARRANKLDARSTLATGRSHSTSGQVDAEDGVLNVLVIQSNVPHNSTPLGPADRLWEKYWDSLKINLSELPHIEKEVNMLRGLGRAYRAGASGTRPKVEVEVLVPRPGKSLRLLAERRLKDRSRHFDIVHFAGHALFARSPVPQDRRGYLIFSGEPGMQPEAVPVATVADWLEGSAVQLVYLSCCRSSAAAAALELAARYVPLTIGFNWDLDDKKAVDFARDFYTELLSAELKVCPAFSKARRNLYGYFAGGDPIWAAPVLIAQPEEWGHVEGVLQPASYKRVKERLTRSRRPPPPSVASDAISTAA